MKKLLVTSLLLTLYVPTSHAFFESIANDENIVSDTSSNFGSSSEAVVTEVQFQDRPEDRLQVVDCNKVASDSVPLKMLNAIRSSKRDHIKLNMEFDKDSKSYKVNVNFPTIMKDCFRPSVSLKRYAGSFAVEVKNVYFTDSSDKRPMMQKYESCLEEKGILKDGKIDREKVHFGTYKISLKDVPMNDIFDGKDNIDHIEAIYASPKNVPREFLTAGSDMSPDQPNNCYNMEYINSRRHDLISKEDLAEHRFQWICDGNGNVLDVDHLLSMMPEEMGNYSNMVKDLQAIKASMKEDSRASGAESLRKELTAALRKVKKFRSNDDRYEYEMAVNKYYEILTKLEEKDIKPLMERLISITEKLKKSSGEERAKLRQQYDKIKNSLRFYDKSLSIDFANKLAKNGFYDEAKLTYLLKAIMEKRTSVNKKITITDSKGKKRKVMLDSYEDMYDYGEYIFKKKSRAKYADLRKQFQIKEEGAEYAEDAYEKAQAIAKGADKRYNSFVEKMQKACKRNFFGFYDDKDKCEKYQKQWKKEAARRQKGYEYAGKYLGEAKKYKKLESEYTASTDDEFGDDDFDMYDADEFYKANSLGSYQRFGTTNYGANSGQLQMPQFGATGSNNSSAMQWMQYQQWMQQQQMMQQYGGNAGMYQTSPFGGTSTFGTFPQTNTFGTGTFTPATGTFGTGTGTFGTQTTTTPVFR